MALSEDATSIGTTLTRWSATEKKSSCLAKVIKKILENIQIFALYNPFFEMVCLAISLKKQDI